MKKILIAIDTGPFSEKIISTALPLARKLEAEIALISVVDTEFLVTEGGITPKEMAELMKSDLIEKQKTLSQKLLKGQNIQTFVEEGKPYEIILKSAEEWNADMIILGTHGRTGINHFLLGSVAEKVVRHSAKPLFIIPVK